MTEIRVPFADTDAMGIVHHSNFLRYFEVARIQWLRERELDYRKWIEKGFHLPLVELTCRYRRPARFEDILHIEVKPRIEKIRVIFEYEIKNKATGQTIAVGTTEHVPVDHEMKRMDPPKDIVEAISKGVKRGS